MSLTIHPSAIIDDGAILGDGTKVWHFSHISSKARIGLNCSFGQNVYIGNDVIIGNNVKVQNNVSIYDSVIIEDDVFCGPSMVFTNVINPRSHIIRKNEYKKTILKKGSTIGANATIVCGNEIGEYSMIGAGSVVTKNILPYELVTGVPGKHLGWVCQCGDRIFFINDNYYTLCNSCSKNYILKSGICIYFPK
jgi:UDP-2-acetamido-3-amino-2,3-dideoxy-glucuronate N-acetyltransferase